MDKLLPLAKTLHVPALIVAYLIFSFAFAVGLLYLWQERQMKSKHLRDWSFQLPSLEGLDNLIFRLIVFAIPCLTTGIFLGVIWAQQASGRLWNWDPGETLALITWFVYIVYLYMRIGIGWKGRKTAYLSLAGFALVLVTYAGVNYLSPLHRMGR